MSARRFLPIAWKLAVGVLALLLTRKYFDYEVFRQALNHPVLVTALISMWIVNQVLISWRLKLLFEHVGCSLSLGRLTRVGFISMLFAGLLPGVVGNDVGKIALLRGANHAIGLPTIAAGVLIDRAIGLATLILVSVAASFFLPATETASQLTIIRIVQVVGLALLAGWGALMVAQRALARFPEPSRTSKLGRIIAGFRTQSAAWTLSITEQLPIAWASILGIGILVLTQAVAAVFLIPGGVETGEIAKVMFLFPALTLSAALPLTPLGLGIGQLAMGEGFALFGLPAAVGVTVATISQLTQVLVAVFIGGFLSWNQAPARHRGESFVSRQPESNPL